MSPTLRPDSNFGGTFLSAPVCVSSGIQVPSPLLGPLISTSLKYETGFGPKLSVSNLTLILLLFVDSMSSVCAAWSAPSFDPATKMADINCPMFFIVLSTPCKKRRHPIASDTQKNRVITGDLQTESKSRPVPRGCFVSSSNNEAMFNPSVDCSK